MESYFRNFLWKIVEIVYVAVTIEISQIEGCLFTEGCSVEFVKNKCHRYFSNYNTFSRRAFLASYSQEMNL